MVTVVHQIGKTIIRVHSPFGVIAMAPEEQQAWFDRELEAGNPMVVRIQEAVTRIYEVRVAANLNKGALK